MQGRLSHLKASTWEKANPISPRRSWPSERGVGGGEIEAIGKVRTCFDTIVVWMEAKESH